MELSEREYLQALALGAILARFRGLRVITRQDFIVALRGTWQIPLAGATSAPLSQQLRLQLQSNFRTEVSKITRGFLLGRRTLASWFANFVKHVKNLHIRTVMLAGEFLPTTEVLRELDKRVFEQLAFAARFRRDLADIPEEVRSSVRRPIHRAMSYAGAGLGTFQMAYERFQGGVGWVSVYVAHDDIDTCQPCLVAQAGGPYLPGRGPMPGDVCKGHTNCRCTRRLLYDPAMYRLLGGESRLLRAA